MTSPNILYGNNNNGEFQNYYSKNINQKIEPNKAKKVDKNTNRFISEIKKNKDKGDVLDDLFGSDKNVLNNNVINNNNKQSEDSSKGYLFFHRVLIY